MKKTLAAINAHCRLSQIKIFDFQDDLESICFREFAEMTAHTWKQRNDDATTPIQLTTTRKVKTRDVNSGHLILHRLCNRKHVRWNTVIYTEPAHLYKPVERGLNTTQTLYYDLDAGRRKQLYHSYQELVCYVPWKSSPDETFLSAENRLLLNDETYDPEINNRYSLRRFELFHQKYMELWEAGEVANEGSEWHLDNQYSHTMYLTTQYNRDIKMARSQNGGVFTARYEGADELVDTEVELRAPLTDEVEEADMPSVLNFLLTDTLNEIQQQKPPEVSEVRVAFPLEYSFVCRQEMVTANKTKLFMADPPAPEVPRDQMTFWHNKAIDLIIQGHCQIIYVFGKAGPGKSELALHICAHFKGAVQAGAGTAKVATNFNGPTTHAMFGWSHDEFQHAGVDSNQQTKLDRLRIFYEDTKVFVIDEVNAMSAAQVGVMDEMMCQIFDPERKA